MACGQSDIFDPRFVYIFSSNLFILTVTNLVFGNKGEGTGDNYVEISVGDLGSNEDPPRKKSDISVALVLLSLSHFLFLMFEENKSKKILVVGRHESTAEWHLLHRYHCHLTRCKYETLRGINSAINCFIWNLTLLPLRQMFFFLVVFFHCQVDGGGLAY